MSEAVTAKQFHEADWRVVRDEASTHFRTGSLAAGVALVNAIGRLADDANHHADVDLRPDGVTVRLRTEGIGGLSEREVALAGQISDAAREFGVPVDPNGPADRPSRDRRARLPMSCRSGAPCSATGRWATRI
jgi:4a-hydroxytetrahydrobiopterin dehydratase